MIIPHKFRTLHLMPRDFHPVRLFGESYVTGWTAYEAWEEGPESPTEHVSAISVGLSPVPPVRDTSMLSLVRNVRPGTFVFVESDYSGYVAVVGEDGMLQWALVSVSPGQ